MITAAEAREKVNNDTNLKLKGIEQSINNAIESASDNFKYSVRVDTKEFLEKPAQAIIIGKLETLGYKAKYEVFTPPQWDGGNSSYYFIISW